MAKKKFNRIAVNGVYLAARYTGSGFHSYLTNFLKQLSHIKAQNHYYVFYPEEKPRLKPCPHLKFIPLPKTKDSGSYLEDIAKNIKTNPFKINKIFLPHLEKIPKNFPLKIYLTIHDIIPTLSLNPVFFFKRKIPWQGLSSKGLIDYLLIKKLTPQVEKIITISKTTQEDLTKLFPPLKHKVKVIPPFISPKFTPQSKKTLQPYLKKFNLTHDGYCLYFGGHTVRKNVEKIMRFFSAHQEVISFPLVVIGKKEMKKAIFAKYRQQSNLVFFNKLPLNDLSKLLAGAKFSIYPSLYEGFGMPLLESLRAGTFPLASNIPATLEITRGLLPTFDPSTLKGLLPIIEKYRPVEKRKKIIRDFNRKTNSLSNEMAMLGFDNLFVEEDIF